MKKFLRFIGLCLILLFSLATGSVLIISSEVQAVEIEIGVVKWFDKKSGVGVIISRNDGQEIFVHFSIIQGKSRSLLPGQSVRFLAIKTDRGSRATWVQPR